MRQALKDTPATSDVGVMTSDQGASQSNVQMTSLVQSVDTTTMFNTLLRIPFATTYHLKHPLHVVADTGATFAEVTREFVDLVMDDQCDNQECCAPCVLGCNPEREFCVWTSAGQCVQERGEVEFTLRVGSPTSHVYRVRAHVTTRFPGPIMVVSLNQPELIFRALPFLMEALTPERAAAVLQLFTMEARIHSRGGGNPVTFATPTQTGNTPLVATDSEVLISTRRRTHTNLCGSWHCWFAGAICGADDRRANSAESYSSKSAQLNDGDMPCWGSERGNHPNQDCQHQRHWCNAQVITFYMCYHQLGIRNRRRWRSN